CGFSSTLIVPCPFRNRYRHINLGGEKGFEISFLELQNLSEPFLNEIKHQCLSESEKLPKIGRNSQDLRDDLADKLQQYILPEGYKLIVIATGIKPGARHPLRR
ncbi:MAG: hypothetical protein ACTS2F_31330, partial [Thainema sp.]